MTDALISLGANLGNPRLSINCAAAMLIDRFGSDSVTLSSLLTSPPIGGPEGQMCFLNAVARIQTPLNLFEMWAQLRDIESSLGRIRRQRWESRRIDLDILLCQDEQRRELRVWTPNLKIPHPRMITRSFALLPAAELVPDRIDPVSGLRLNDIAALFPYHYDPGSGIIEQVDRNKKTQVLILVTQPQIHAALQSQWRKEIELKVSVKRTQVHFRMLDHPYHNARTPSASDLHQIDRWLEELRPDLFVLGVTSPENAGAWEDFASPWAEYLGMKDGQSPRQSQWRLPKYLLNCGDMDWALHELQAACAAMQCELHFAKPGFELIDPQ